MTSPDQNYTSWHVGMRVVCRDNRDFECWLNVDDIYTIKSIGMGMGAYKGRYTTHVVVVLAEVDNPDDAFFPMETPGFCAARFRPVQTRKTDISVFTSMLSPKPAKAGKVRA
ncbi:hypothetical protein [Aminobacter sp. MDW-2]|uniref:hypothetical protein n=1 Tax=Aminobacter sp. MDW-2 TaxID=2666139 RepID=UPI0012AF1C7A|nr:hypothetical protein [Aminobacter sp. MDW-2]MRX31892.1 hypothetical protein [Aminobacter sp. MDW-2]QNH32366.1 hypothetical protein H5P29_17595 [Aminobacter sp. MDW-2]